MVCLIISFLQLVMKTIPHNLNLSTLQAMVSPQSSCLFVCLFVSKQSLLFCVFVSHWSLICLFVFPCLFVCQFTFTFTSDYNQSLLILVYVVFFGARNNIFSSPILMKLSHFLTRTTKHKVKTN